jgi:Ca2+-binding RTX toxin-like protein
VDGQGGTDTLLNIENARGFTFNDTLIGSAANNSLEGREGNDTLLGGDGQDTLSGGIGDDSLDGGDNVANIGTDWAIYNLGSGAVTVNLATGVATGSEGNDTLVGIESVQGTAFADTLTGNDVQNLLQGGDGNDTIDGGLGNDFIDYNNASAAVTVSLVSGTSSGGAGVDTFINMEYIRGSGFGDTLTGDANNNLIRGMLGNDTIDGGLGSDTADYFQATSGVTANLATNNSSGADGADIFTSIENLRGSNNSDFFTGDANANVLTGLAGNDSLLGGGGNDTLFGNEGQDTLVGGAGNDSLDGGVITDLLNYTDLNFVRFDGATTGVVVDLQAGTAQDGQGGLDTLANLNFVVGTQFNDSITGSSGIYFEQFEGGDGNDTINGGVINASNNFASNRASFLAASGAMTVDLRTGTATGQGTDTLININYVRGSNFNDHLFGSDTTANSELFEGRGGNDTIDGRGGFDWYRLDGSTTGGVVDLSAGLAEDGQGGLDTLINIEAARGAVFNDELIGNQFNNSLEGREGNDTLEAGFGQDTVNGGVGDDFLDGGSNDSNLGTDWVVFTAAVGPVNVNLTAGTATGEGNDTLVGIESAAGTAFNDVLTGSDEHNILQGGLGNDTIDGAGGFDYVDYANSSGSVTVSLATGTSSGAAGVDTFINMEGIRGSNFNDTLTGDGNDNLFRGTLGDDVLDGGLGNDLADYFQATGSVTASLVTNTSSGADGNDTFISIENLRGGNFDDRLEGNGVGNNLSGLGGADSLIGGAGNDSLYGGEGQDTLIGGLGDDFIDGGGQGSSELDFVIYSGATGSVNVNLTTGLATGAEGNDTLTGVEAVIGGASNDVLTGNGNENFLRGNGGNDTLDGGAGFDWLDYKDATATVTVNLATGVAGGGNQGADTFSNMEAIRGGSAGDSLTGDGNNNNFRGQLGNDTISGGGGFDLSDYREASGAVTVNLAAGTATGADGSDTLSSIEAVRGSSFDDSITGDANNNRLDGGLGAGNDTLTGMAGADTLLGGDGNDLLDGGADDDNSLSAGSGNDTVFGGTGNDYILAGWFDGAGNDTMDGGDGNDIVNYTLYGASSGVFFASSGSGTGQRTQIDATGGTDTLVNIEEVHIFGSQFGDTLVGDGGHNFIQGNEGNDTLTGNGSNDTFSYFLDIANGQDRITDFGTGDNLSFNRNVGPQFAITGVSSGAGGSGLLEGQVRVGPAIGGVTTIYVGTDSVAGGDLAIELLGTYAPIDFTFFNSSFGASLNYESGQVYNGTEGADTLTGGNGSDSIFGNGGNDNLSGNGGNDTIDGGLGDDFISGGPGNDSIFGNEGNDYLQVGGSFDGGSDTVNGGNGNDVAHYGFEGSTAPVTFTGTGASGTQVDPTGGTDTLISIEEQHIFGSNFADTLAGDSMRNYFQGNGGNDTLTGGGGSDTFSYQVTQANGTDRITDFGSGDNLYFPQFTMSTTVLSGDTPTGLTQGQVMVGAFTGGITRVYVGTNGTAGADITVELAGNFPAGNFSVFTDSFGSSLNYFAAATSPTAGPDSITGTGGNDNIDALAGNDTVDALGGNDTLFGGTGDDRLLGNSGFDRLRGDAGNDTLDGGADNDVVEYNFGAFTAPVTFTSTHNGQTTASQADGLGGIDSLVSVEELHVFGGSGADVITGGTENNFLEGNGGNDTLTGGGGNDFFGFQASNASTLGVDRVADLGVGDFLHFRGLPITSVGAGTGTGLTAGQVRFGAYDSGTNTTQVFVGTNGTAGSDLTINLNGNFAASDFQIQNDTNGNLRYTPGVLINGTEGPDFLQGDAGNDTINGFGGDDNLQGFGGNDSISGGEGNDFINGGAGNDTMNGGPGFDMVGYFDASAGVSVNLGSGVVGGAAAGDVFLDIENLGGSGFNDTLTGTGDNNYIDGSAGNDSIVGLAGDDNLNGGLGDDTLIGGDGNDYLTGGDGNDSLNGGLGTDTASWFGASAGVLVNISTSSTGGAATGDAITAIEGLGGSSFNDTLTGSSINNFIDGAEGNDSIVGLAGDDNLNGSGGNDTILGGDGNDGLNGGAGADSIDGGNGEDFLNYFDATSSVTVNLATNANAGAAAGDVLLNIENLGGSAFNDSLVGSASSNFIDGGLGNDTILGLDGDDNLQGGLGNDMLDGGSGANDRVEYGQSSGAIVVNLTAGTATGSAGSDTLLNIENIGGTGFADSLTGNDANNNIDGSAGNDTIFGLGGNDFLQGGMGDDSIDGGAGTGDTADYFFSAASSAINVNLATGLVTGGGGNDTLTGIENISGSAFNDIIVGDANANYFDGRDGNDSMSGGAGRDTFQAGAGNDTMDGGAILDRIAYSDLNSLLYNNATSAVNINLATGTVTDGFGGVDTISNINFVTGSNFGDTLTGSTTANMFEQFEGGLGNDTINGGAIDTVTQSNGNRVNYANSSGAVTVDLGAGTSTGAAGNDTLTNINSVTGSSFNDSLVGSNSTAYSEEFEGRAGNDTINGLGGVDSVRYDGSTAAVNANLVTGVVSDGWGGTDTLLNMEGLRGSNFNDVLTGGNAANGTRVTDGFELFIGNGGNDTIDGGGGYDRVQFNSSTAAVNVTLGGSSNGTAQDGLGGTDTLINIEAVRGSQFNDTLTGSNSGLFESFDGRGGDDLINGMGGIDRVEYAGESAAVTINLATGTATDGAGGIDTLISIEHARGSAFNDTITGDAGANRIEGMAGNDTINAGAGYDTIVYSGARSAYTVTGMGTSTLTVAGPDGTDTVTGADRLIFSNSLLNLRQTGADFDGDGFADLFWRNGPSGNNVIWRNADSGVGQGVANVPAFWNVVGIGDFNADGNTDILFRNTQSGANVVWRSGDSTDGQALDTLADMSWKAAAVADFNGDGGADILWRNSTTGVNVVWRNGQSATAQVLTTLDTTWKVAGAGDFNGDNVFDILWRNADTGANVIWRGGDSTQTQAVTTLAPNSNMQVAGIGDFNGDNTSDILWRNTTTGTNVIWRGGDSTQTQAVATQNAAFNVEAVGDYNGDGTSDIVWRHSTTGENLIWTNANSATVQEVTDVGDPANWKLPVQDNANNVPKLQPTPFDLNGNGTSDVLWRNTATGQNVIWRDGSSANTQAVTTVTLDWKVAAIEDFNGDGVSDLFFRSTNSGLNVIWRGGDSANGQAMGTVDLNWNVVGAGDFNGDGKADVLFRHKGVGANVIWDSGDSATGHLITAVGDLNWKVAGIGDFNGDGKSDILWRHQPSGGNVIWGAGDSNQAQQISQLADTNWKVGGIGDFNADGVSDILWRNTATGANMVWDSADSAQSHALTTVDMSWSIVGTGDYNSDGSADILWRHAASGTNVVWEDGDSAKGIALTAQPSDWTLQEQDHTWLNFDWTYPV